MKTKRLCEHCHTQLPEEPRINQRFCSEKCQRRAYGISHKKEISTREKNYRQVHKARIRAWYKANKQHMTTANKEQLATYQKRWREANKEKMAAYMKVWGKANKEAIAAIEKTYRQAHPEAGTAARRRRRARKAGVPHEKYDRIKDVFEPANWTCQICGCKVSTGGNPYRDDVANADHVTPLSKGGFDILSNIQCVCRRCNAVKGAKIQESA